MMMNGLAPVSSLVILLFYSYRVVYSLNCDFIFSYFFKKGSCMEFEISPMVLFNSFLLWVENSATYLHYRGEI